MPDTSIIGKITMCISTSIMGSGGRVATMRRYAALTLVSAVAFSRIVRVAAMVELHAMEGEGPALGGDVIPKAKEGLHLSWRAVPMDRRPTSDRRGLRTPEDVTVTAKVANTSERQLQEGAGAGVRAEGGAEVGAGAGGQFGLSADWQEAVSMPGKDGRNASLRGEVCETEEKQEDVHDILRKSAATSDGSKVAVCVRTKDSGRFLPEWIAYHYALGVNEISVYDDDSIDDTKQILQPFVDAGMVVYLFQKIQGSSSQMKPLNHCLEKHIRRRTTEPEAPAWILFHDVDEYIFPTDTNATISQALMKRSDTCCLKVPRVQYGTGGYLQMPRGLLLEQFLTHAHLKSIQDNRLPKIMVNLNPGDPLLGLVAPPLKSMHNARGCECEKIPVSEIRINHYLGSEQDYLQKTRRFWKGSYTKQKVEKFVHEKDVNDETSDAITRWACATREILYRVVEGLDLGIGLE